jgi:hypothetical protein
MKIKIIEIGCLDNAFSRYLTSETRVVLIREPHQCQALVHQNSMEEAVLCVAGWKRQRVATYSLFLLPVDIRIKRLFPEADVDC